MDITLEALDKHLLTFINIDLKLKYVTKVLTMEVWLKASQCLF